MFIRDVTANYGPFDSVFPNYLVASLSKRVLGAILLYKNEISFTCKLNAFSYEWLGTRPRFYREASGNSEIDYFNQFVSNMRPLYRCTCF